MSARHLPTDAGSCTTVFAAVTNPMVCSSVFPAAFIDDAERFNASPMPSDPIANLLPHFVTLLFLLNKRNRSFLPISHVSFRDYIMRSDYIFTLLSKLE